MPRFEKLSAAEVERLKKRRPATLELTEYLSFLNSLGSGDWGTITLEAGETQRAVKRRLTIAAKQKGLAIRYKRSEEGRIIFQVK